MPREWKEFCAEPPGATHYAREDPRAIETALVSRSAGEETEADLE